MCCCMLFAVREPAIDALQILHPATQKVQLHVGTRLVHCCALQGLFIYKCINDFYFLKPSICDHPFYAEVKQTAQQAREGTSLAAVPLHLVSDCSLHTWLGINSQADSIA